MKWYFIVLIAVAVGAIGFFVGRSTSKGSEDCGCKDTKEEAKSPANPRGNKPNERTS